MIAIVIIIIRNNEEVTLCVESAQRRSIPYLGEEVHFRTITQTEERLAVSENGS